MTHWAVDYIGKPWQRGAKGPDAFDCLGLVTHVLDKHYGIQLDPPANYDGPDLKLFKTEIARRDDWTIVDVPADGDICVMGRSRLPIHIGIMVMVDSLRCLHSVESAGTSSGVLVQRLLDLRFTGWGRITFYRHNSKCS